MSYFHQIKNSKDKWYKEFLRIYSISFPVYELRNQEQQLYAFNNEHYHLFYLIENNTFNSFISFWNFDEYVYVEHLAVNDQLRGQNIGTSSLMKFQEEIKKTIILEIDPIIDEISAKRLLFYKKIGFNQCLYKHYHPAYDLSYSPHELLVLSTGSVLTLQQYDIFRKDLGQIVMRFS